MRWVIASVRYADFLAVTLPAWKAIVPSGLVVATSPEDEDTQAVAENCGVPCIITDAWTRPDPLGHNGGKPTFNLGFALNVALGLRESLVTPPAPLEVLGHASADCYPFGTWPDDKSLEADRIYGFWRHECLTPNALEAHRSGATARSRYPRLKNSGGRPIGYCQFFRNVPGRAFGSYPTAGKFDTHFVEGVGRHEMLDNVYLLHLGEHDNHRNWGGRVLPAWGSA